ncbi:beta-mannosidase [Fopius arisanus]|uniref:Beta-mannosidase n=1 Tax=Fopius arisanus TaxID=64838 RepID=A0A0C9QBE2_9HYME|nr:PREDICTED: beta-mannosidase [Fopius arisanus]XP_011301909.1 PREDICTED: beta-mannosidase [Fopius arisanus]
MRLSLAIILSIVLSTRADTLDIWQGVVGNKYFTLKVPGDTYQAYGANGANDPLHGDNDVNYRWIGNSSSYLRNIFLVDESQFAADRVLLVFQGVDTFAKISLNDHELGNTSNMHLRYVYDVKDYLKFPEQNKISITFDSPVKVAEALYNNQSKSYPVYPKCVPSSYNGECHVNHIRKMQASFSWDWGPAFPGSGLWSIPELMAFNDSTILDTTADVELIKDHHWQVRVTVTLMNAPSSASKPLTGVLTTRVIHKDTTWNYKTKKYDPEESYENSTSFTFTNNEKTSTLSLIILIPEAEVSRWWPNGYGDQSLYTVNTTLRTSRHYEHKTQRIGFRTVELVQKPLEKGLSFYFRVNSVDIFAKGTNIIPISILAERTGNKTVRGLLLRYMQETNQNMVRVWGGGIYEIDHFYDMADEYGIMVWQDFMFACAMYPTTREFLESVRTEVKQNVLRLKNHPSVVLWAGNNENEAALYGNWYGTGKDEVYRNDYIKLYVDLIKKEVEANDKTRPFLVSSPTNGDYSANNGWVETDPYSNLYGDIHYYNYVFNGWNINTYKRPRFASEYGFQSLPSIKTLRSGCQNPENDLVRGSDFLQHRQHLPGGDGIMLYQIKLNLNVPDTNDSLRDLESYIYLSQINQAVAVKVQTESYRQAKSTVNEMGEGRTMGALYWQLNDVWQAPSWSSIDVDGRWKILHNYAKDFFAPVIVTPRVTLDQLKIFIVSDLLLPIVNCSVEIRFHRIWSESMPQVYAKQLESVTVPPNSAIELSTLSLEGILAEASCGSTFQEAKKKCIIELILRDSSNQQLAPPNYVYPGPPKDYDLPACDLYAAISRYPSFNLPEHLRQYYDGYEVTITSGCTQLFVWFDGNGFYTGKFSENGFHLLEGSKKIFFLENRMMQPEIQGITVTTLGSIYATPKPRMEFYFN